MKLEILKDLPNQFMKNIVSGIGEEMFHGKYSCRVIRSSDKNFWKAS